MILFFDLDGPILDVSHRYAALHRELLAPHGIDAMDLDRYWTAKRARRREADILAELGATHAGETYERERLDCIETAQWLAIDRCWPWALTTLCHLAEHATLVMVTARAKRDVLLDQLDALAIRPHFHEILSEAGGERVDWQKAALMRDYLARHALPETGHWMIGDTEADVLAGRAMGFTTVAVLTGIRDENHLRAAEPDHLVPDIRVLPTLLNLPPAKSASPT